MPEWVTGLLTLLFGQLGSLGVVCLAAAAYSAWLHYQEKLDHKETRKFLAEDAEKRQEIARGYLQTLTELKMVLQQLVTDQRHERR